MFQAAAEQQATSCLKPVIGLPTEMGHDLAEQTSGQPHFQLGAPAPVSKKRGRSKKTLCALLASSLTTQCCQGARQNSNSTSKTCCQRSFQQTPLVRHPAIASQVQSGWKGSSAADSVRLRCPHQIGRLHEQRFRCPGPGHLPTIPRPGALPPHRQRCARETHWH